MILEDNMLAKLEDEYSRCYFNDILQSYYSKNYRGAVVLLYSFVVFDLFKKLQNMEYDEIKSAKSKIKEIRQMIQNDEPYSRVEHTVIDYFKNECNGYFKRFEKDIDYLTELRHRCAHLNFDDDVLFTPKDYQVSMLINSMYDNIFSVRSPIFIDIFTIAQPEIEKATKKVGWVSWPFSLDEKIKNEISKKFIT